MPDRRPRTFGSAALLAALVAALLVALALVGCAGNEVPLEQGSQPDRAEDPKPELAAVEDGCGFEVIPGVVAELQPAVVAVLTDIGEGSGVVYDDDGIIVTNAHVIGDYDEVEVAFADGERVPAEVVATDLRSDLAVLRVEVEDLAAASFAESLPRVGELAIALGNPLGFENSVTAGIISGLARAIPGSAPQTAALIDLIQTDAAISPGNSGGALVNARGQVVGINVAYIPPEARAVSIGFAIPATTVTDVVDQLLDTGRVSYAFVGIEPTAITAQIAEDLGLESTEGVIVRTVVADGPAEEAGMRPGDIITAVAGEDVPSVEDFLARLRELEPGDAVEMGIVRDGDVRQLDVVLADRPDG